MEPPREDDYLMIHVSRSSSKSFMSSLSVIPSAVEVIQVKLISVKMPEALIEGMDELVRRGSYPSRSAVMRTAVRDLLKKELWK